MRTLAFLPAFFVILLVSTSASAQGSHGTGSNNEFHTGEPVFPDSDERSVRHQLCNVGDKDACFAIEFGQCADRNPRLAIPACTRQLVQQDNRRTGGNVRFEHAIRYMLRANAHLNLGNMDLALADYDRAVVTNGSVFWIHAQRGDAYFLTGNFEQALGSYDAALALNPDSAAVLNNRALVLAAAPNEALHDAGQALANAQRANSIAPGQPAYIDALAVAYAANGDFDRAAAEEQRAIDLLPPGNQAVLDDFRSRLDLFENREAFRIAPRAGS